LLGGVSAHPQAIITTMAGGHPVEGAVHKQAISPRSIAVSADGGYYFTDFNTNSVYSVDRMGEVRRVAGTGIYGFSGDGEAALEAKLGTDLGVDVEASGNLVITDRSNNRIRLVSGATHEIHTIAGTGAAGYGGDGGPATAANFNGPYETTHDAQGQIYIADYGNCLVRKIDRNGVVHTIAGTAPAAGGSPICGYSGDGGPATVAQLNYPNSLAIDARGDVFIADSSNSVIRRVDGKTGDISTYAGNGGWGFSGDGGPATAAELNFPFGVALDGAGNLLIDDFNNTRIRRVSAATGIISTIAGNGSVGFAGDRESALLAEFSYPNQVVSGTDGNVLIADLGNGRVRRIDSRTGIIGTVAGGGLAGDGGWALDAQIGIAVGFTTGICVDHDGHLFIADNDNNRVRRVDLRTNRIEDVAGNPHGAYGVTGNGVPATEATMGYPGDVTADAAGNIYFDDWASDSVRRVDAITGILTIVAGNGVFGYSGDGGPAINAEFGGLESVGGVDAAGNVYVPDTYNERIRMVNAKTGIITTVAGNGTAGLSGDGGLAVNAELNNPYETAIDQAGNIYIADQANGRIREVIAKSGIIQTIAGNGTVPWACAYSGDGGPATQAGLCNPWRIAVDKLGNVFISDGTSRIRRVDAKSHIITTVAGNGTEGFTGDGGAATAAEISPAGVAVDGNGVLYIEDSGSGRIRMVEPR
jgi:streptogramin lyase